MGSLAQALCGCELSYSPFDHSSPNLQEALEKLEAHNLVSIDSDDDDEQGRDSIVATV